MNESRLIEIETKVLYQEDTLEQLHKVVYAQQETITKLQAALQLLTKNFHNSAGISQEIGPANEKPPHY